MYTRYPDGTISCSSCVHAIDLIKVANQIFQDKMQYVNIEVFFSDREDMNGQIKISAIPSAMSDDSDVKRYSSISRTDIIDTDIFEEY